MAKQTREASFRGVKFQVFSVESTFGRRLAEHVFVKRDTPYQEDLGRKAREFSIEAFVSGADYATQRDALISAIETEGPGQLIHPYYGNRQVTIRSFRVREAAGEKGMARLDFDCVEAGQLSFPKSVIDPNSKLSEAVDGVRSASATDFLKKFDVLSKPQFVVDSAISKVNEAADFVKTQGSSVSNLSQGVTDLAFSVRNLKADATDLVNEPAALRDRLSSAVRLLSSVVTSKDDSYKVQSGFYSFGHADIVSPYNTPSRVAQTQNSGAINSLMIRESICQGALDAALIKHKSTEDAGKIRQSLFDAIESQKESTDDDDVYAALLLLKARVAQAVPPVNQTLPSVVMIELPQSLPSLVLTYSLYESLDREQDIIDRNSVSDPSFIPGGVDLKVLKDG
jgi:prophage DNA circulation protein